MPEYKKYIRCNIVKATPMTRSDYNEAVASITSTPNKKGKSK